MVIALAGEEMSMSQTHGGYVPTLNYSNSNFEELSIPEFMYVESAMFCAEGHVQSPKLVC